MGLRLGIFNHFILYYNGSLAADTLYQIAILSLATPHLLFILFIITDFLLAVECLLIYFIPTKKTQWNKHIFLQCVAIFIQQK